MGDIDAIVGEHSTCKVGPAILIWINICVWRNYADLFDVMREKLASLTKVKSCSSVIRGTRNMLSNSRLFNVTNYVQNSIQISDF